MQIRLEDRRPAATEMLTVSTTAVSLTESKYSTKTIQAQITVEDGPLRYRTDGLPPTASVGHRADDGSTILLIGYTEISNFQVVCGGTDGAIVVTYYV